MEVAFGQFLTQLAWHIRPPKEDVFKHGPEERGREFEKKDAQGAS